MIDEKEKETYFIEDGDFPLIREENREKKDWEGVDYGASTYSRVSRKLSTRGTWETEVKTWKLITKERPTKGVRPVRPLFLVTEGVV